MVERDVTIYPVLTENGYTYVEAGAAENEQSSRRNDGE